MAKTYRPYVPEQDLLLPQISGASAAAGAAGESGGSGATTEMAGDSHGSGSSGRHASLKSAPLESPTGSAARQAAVAAAVLPKNGIDIEQAVAEIERAYIRQALDRSNWNQTEAAKLLGLTFRSIRYKIQKLGI